MADHEDQSTVHQTQRPVILVDEPHPAHGKPYVPWMVRRRELPGVVELNVLQFIHYATSPATRA